MEHELLNVFARACQSHDFTPDTQQTYNYNAQAWLSWCQLRSLGPLVATRADVEAHRDELRARKLAPSTVSHRIIIVRAFYEALLAADLVNDNPAARVRVRRGARSGNYKALSLEQLQTLLASFVRNDLETLRDRAIVTLMALHGLRRIEVHRLNHDALHLDTKNPFIEVEGKGRKPRRVYLRDDTLQILRAWLHAKIEAQLPATGAVFVSLRRGTRGERLTREGINAAVERRLSAVELREKGVSCHALRHTFGTLAVAGGASIEQVRDAMGHSNLATTSIYIRAHDRAKNNPAKFIEIS